MLIFDDNNRTIILDDIYTPTPTDFMWVLDLQIMDYTLAPLLVLEEIVCPSIKIKIRGFEFFLPANWNMLIYSEETSELDVVEISELAGKEFTSFVYDLSNPDIVRYLPGTVTVVDYSPEFTNVAPSLNKHQMLCHPISPTEWVNVSPSDTYNKYLKTAVVGDIL
jgi:hypothetical protein